MLRHSGVAQQGAVSLRLHPIGFPSKDVQEPSLLVLQTHTWCVWTCRMLLCLPSVSPFLFLSFCGVPRPSCLLSEHGARGLAQSWPPTLAPQGWTLPRLVGEDSRTWQATVENIHSQAKVLKHCQRITGSLKWQELSQGTTMALGFYFVSEIL